MLVVYGALAALFVFWTIPVTFLSAFANLGTCCASKVTKNRQHRKIFLTSFLG
jgi:hypothetical protein